MQMMFHKAEHKEITKLEVILITIILSIDLKNKYVYMLRGDMLVLLPKRMWVWRNSLCILVFTTEKAV